MFDDLTIRSLANSSQKNILTNNNAQAVSGLTELFNVLEDHLRNNSNIEKSCNWMLAENLWLENEKGNLKSFYKYSRGDIIRIVDFGTSNIGTEIRYPHPLVVLYDQNEDWVLGVPITQATIDLNGKPVIHHPFEVFVAKQLRKPKDINEFWFTKPSVIQIDQIKRVSKFRAINKKRYKLRIDLLNQIDNIIFQNITPKKNELLNNMINTNQQNVSRINNLEDENNKLRTEIEHLKDRVNILKSEIIDLRAKLA